MNTNVIIAIFRRNFYSYFSTPTGYVFICVFVLLSSFAAFWSSEFFNANLANLDQLNRWLPYILLVFIPAITMSIWAEEKRQGTDELLLTIPAGDFDVVLGKYLAAVAIYSAALLFSFVCNFLMLLFLGSPDVGLFVGTYVGYWFVGLAMLAIGMVASFLTGNLTVGFVLGALFNAPLAFASSAELILPPSAASVVRQWSLEQRFNDFGRGVVSLSSILYFVLIVVAMLYLCMVLIGRRHWQGGRDGQSLGGHYLIRAFALSAAAVGAVLIAHRHDVRVDVTEERLSSLSPESKKLIKELEVKQPIDIQAYISPNVPESYVPTRLNLINTLQEFAAMGGDKVRLEIFETEPLSDNADRAEQQFGITGHQVMTRQRGAVKFDDIYLGVAFKSGLKKVVVPFFDRGLPVEYEVVRSICTLGQQKRKRLGVLTTDAKLFGGFDPQTFTPTQDQPMIEELRKQYDVVQVSPDQPITEKYDVLLAVQPSSLSQEQMNHFIAAVRKGQPTAIFEDPFPRLDPSIPGTTQPKSPGGGGMMAMMQQQRPMPKGDINALWDLLGVKFNGGSVVWQKYNPLTKTQAFITDEWVFADVASGAEDPFSAESPMSSSLQQMLFLYPGSVSQLNSSELKFDRLITIGERPRGTVAFQELMEFSPFGGARPKKYPRRVQTDDRFVLAAWIHGKPKPVMPAVDDAAALVAADDELCADDEKDDATNVAESHDGKDSEAKGADGKSDEKSPAEAKEASVPAEEEINVVVVADVDLMLADFLLLRQQGTDPDREFNLNLDNVTFVLNVLDVLADDERFVEIRKRRPKHRTLDRVDVVTALAREENIEQHEKFAKKLEQAKSEAESQFQAEIQKLRSEGGDMTLEKMQRVAMLQERGNQELQAKVSKMQKEMERDTRQIDKDLDAQIRSVQNRYKLWAVLLPPIPPLLVGLGVFFGRRISEREGVAKSRLR